MRIGCTSRQIAKYQFIKLIDFREAKWRETLCAVPEFFSRKKESQCSLESADRVEAVREISKTEICTNVNRCLSDEHR